MQDTANSHTLYRTRCDQPVAFVSTHNAGVAEYQLPQNARERLMIDVIHDGSVIPEEFLIDSHGKPVHHDQFWHHYQLERDWGASMVAKELARLLGVDGFLEVQIARVLIDFGRFPGITPKDADYVSRHAINYPFSDILDYEQKRRVLEHYYDAISEHFNALVSRRQVKIAIHTYDTYNSSGTRRPPMSILTRCVGYQIKSEMPFGVFDPLYPDILGEFTCDRILRDRISISLEMAGIHTEHNYPYLLPDGSVEVRSQVWNFFRMARAAFEEEQPDTVEDPAFERVWKMLLDTNLRSSASEMLRSYIHAYRRVPLAREQDFITARCAYERICEFVRRDNNRFTERYRVSRMRPSALGIEIRKDLVYHFDGAGQPVAPNPDEAHRLAGILARAIHTYFTEDCPRARTHH